MIWLSIEKDRELPLTRQIVDQISSAILSGRLQPGEQLPSTRELASTLRISRNAIMDAYEQLVAEGYLVSRSGSGTYVEDGVYLESGHQSKLSSSKDTVNNILTSYIDFRSGLPNLELFPYKKWGYLAQEICGEAESSIWSYGDPQGREELRGTLAGYLHRTRGVNCHPGQILITSGAVQALTLVAKLLLNDQRPFIIEEPSNNDIRSIFCSSGSPLIPIQVDQFGIKTQLLPVENHPAFVFTTPSHQFPLGGNLPVKRRVELIQFARKSSCFIVEDDYDSEYRYEGFPVSSLQGLDPYRVLYIGSFSKILSPALRLGYIVVPENLVQPCREIKRLLDLHSPTLEQLVMAKFIKEGHLGKHIARMKKLYKSRRDHVVKELNTVFSGSIQISGDKTGLHLIVQFPGRIFDDQLLNACLEAGVRVYPVEEHALIKGYHQDKILLGYGHLEVEKIIEGIRKLANVLGK